MPFKKGHKGFSKKRDSLGTPKRESAIVYEDDEDMVDADGEGEEVAEGEEDLDEEASTPAAGDNDDEDGEPTITSIPGRKPRGGKRSRGGARASMRTPEPGDDESESGTPYRRRPRGRGGAAAGRRSLPARRRVTQPAADQYVMVDGQKFEVLHDDAQLDFDAEGEEKVDEFGHLSGDREYRVRTFKIIGRGERLYMLSTEPARCCGFRDSYLFFNKHPKLFKVLLGDAEKKDLIERDILPNSYKGRNIGVVTARSVFREFGAKIVVAGKKVVDDYKASEARANGDVEGELADPNDSLANVGGGTDYNRNRYVAWFGASDVYKIQPAGPQAAGKPGVPGGGKRRTGITVGNWQYMHAREASRFNSAALALRRKTHEGVYDTHTNLMFMPSIMQPTHVRWEHIPPPPPSTTHSQPSLTNGTSHPSPPPASSLDSLFDPVPAALSSTHAVIDTHYTSPPISSFSPFPSTGSFLNTPFSSSSPSDIPDELIAELPEDCKQALLAVRAEERKWQDSCGWGSEGVGGARGRLKVGFAGYPV
ncbi:hypothetical protein B0A48_03879 [Cryoendolithus antarcticus]|uniref:Uncharacterized protein n=1 Tax=Cryoendolithus antarcticus TaxID=1507870 RepID=A0A1V8TH64_9PEZI|nr:hypothetical protein B0A48_03879 [Cryoendolithus antarcticus]